MEEKYIIEVSLIFRHSVTDSDPEEYQDIKLADDVMCDSVQELEAKEFPSVEEAQQAFERLRANLVGQTA